MERNVQIKCNQCSLMFGISRELIKYGIIVNGVAPGMVETPFYDKFASGDNRLERMASSVPFKRAATPLKIAEEILS